MNTAECIVKILENSGVKHIFGHPGEQIIPFYGALNNSKIDHVLMRHEQGAVHAADAYSRVSGNFGVCISTAGPGALNMVMGVGVAFKDSIPLLVITGDNSLNHENDDEFQDIDIEAIFKPITIKTFNPKNGRSAINNIKKAVKILNNESRGPIHINFPKNVLLDKSIDDNDCNLDLSSDYYLFSDYRVASDLSYDYCDYNKIDEALLEIKKSRRPLIVAGAGIFWADSIEELKKFSEINKIPIAHTYHSKGLINDYGLELGLVGIRGSKMANFAFKNADLIIFLGSKISERTTHINSNFDFKNAKTKVISVNIDQNVLFGDIKIHANVKKVLNHFNHSKIVNNSSKSSFNNLSNNSWVADIFQNNEKIHIDGLESKEIPLKPQVAIKLIMEYFNDLDNLDNFKDYILVNDAGSHTTWVNLISEIYNKRIIFSGAMAPMGYGLPAACGASISKPNNKVILINGDGGFQMNVQELATISSNKLPILIIVLNNSQLGVIRQWETIYNEDLRYSVDLENPDFLKLANAYGIEAESVNSIEELISAIKNLKLDKPYLLEVLIAEEDIPLVKF